MAYMNQEKKKVIAAKLKEFMPKSWKYSLAVRNHSTIVMTIKSAPINLVAEYVASTGMTSYTDNDGNPYASINTYHAEDKFLSADTQNLITKIIDTLNTDNYDNSDVMTDYFNVGHYTDLDLGKWNKGFIVK
jgi:hypothetical protein